MPSDPMIGFAIVVVLGMAAQWLAWRLRLPSILLLLLFGFASGPGRLNLLDPDRLLGDLLLPIVAVSAALILFEGGLSLNLREVKAHGRIVARLVTVGLLITWGLATLAARYLVGLEVGASVLLGAILTVSGPTVVQPLLRHIRPRGATATILKWEGIVIDPIGAVLAVLVFETLLSSGARSATWHALQGILLTVLVGGALGIAGAYLLIFLLRRYWIPDYLHNPMALGFVVGAFVASNLVVPDSGLLTVTLMGIVLANRANVSVRHIVEFKENLRVLLISGVFVLLAARLRLTDFERLSAGALLFVAALILVVRPLSVFVCALGTPLTWKERVFLAWMFPRGIVAAAVASVFALEMSAANMPGAADLVPLVFLVIVATVVVYGLTAEPLARRLGLATPNPQGVLMVGAHRWARAMAQALREEDVPVRLVDTNRRNVTEARMEGLPVWYGSALAEHALEDLDLSDLGRLLVLTPNDEVNTLTTLHYLHVFGRERVYQLAIEKTDRPRTESVPTDLRGRTLFSGEATYWALASRVAAGQIVKTTGLSEKFTFEDFRRRYGDGALPLFTVQNGQLAVATADKPLKPQAGQTLIALVPQAETAEDAPPAGGADAG